MKTTIQIPVTQPDTVLYDNITYSVHLDARKLATVNLKMQVMCPFYDLREKRIGHPLPLIIWVGGGAWASSRPYRMIPNLVDFTRREYVVASIDYRVSSTATFPAQIQDLKAAIRYLRIHADEYGIDPERIALMGDSAGGHLVTLAGLTGDREDFGTKDYPGVSDAVRAVVDLFGPADLSICPAGGADSPAAWLTPESRLIGGHASVHPELARIASPIAHITKDAPPFLILHGTEDATVPIQQSDAFYKALISAGVDADYYRLEGAKHATAEFVQPEVTEIILHFLDRFLKI